MEINSPTMRAVERSLDGMALRQEALANNIANSSTPGYVNQEVNFEASLRDALSQAEGPSGSSDPLFGLLGGESGSDGASVTSGGSDVLLTWQPKTIRSADGPQRLDGNTTPLEQEMSQMASNQLKYTSLTTVIAKNYSLLKTIAQTK